MSFARLLGTAVALWGLGLLPTMAQDAAVDDAATAAAGGPAAAAPAAAAAWATRCISDSRQATPSCTIEQRLLMQNTGQLVGSLTIQLRSGAKPTIVADMPLGLFIQGGVTIDVDGTVIQKLDLQTCDRNGCYATGVLSDNVISAAQHGKKFDVNFQSMSKQTVTLPMSLVGFSAALQKAK